MATGQVTQVPRDSDEFARVEHMLQLSARSVGVKDVTAWAILNPGLGIAYERKSQALLSVDCWLDITTLDEANPIQEVCRRGFKLPMDGNGLEFTTGNIAFDPDGPGACSWPTRARSPTCAA